jgi:hypothetical protein
VLQVLANGTEVNVKDDDESQIGKIKKIVLEGEGADLAATYHVFFPDGEGEFGEGELGPQPGMKILSVDYL